jgi:tetratricopeptide (TPR) repeat protein
MAVYSAAVVASSSAFTDEEGGDGKDRYWRLGGRPLLWCAVVAAGVLFVGWARTEVRWTLADRSFNEQRSYLETDSNAVIDWGGRVLAYNPHRKDALKYIGRAQVSSGKLEEAKKTLQRVVGFYPYSPGYRYFLALAEFRLGSVQEAEGHLQFALSVVPREGRLHNLMGRIKSNSGDPENALRHHRMASQLEPGNGLYHYNYGVEAYRQELFEEAAKAFAACVEADEANAGGHKWLGLTLADHLENPAAGIPHLKRALELNPGIDGAARLRRSVSRYEQSAGGGEMK